MTYIRGIWLFGRTERSSGSLELILSKRFSSVESRLRRLLGEDYVGVPNDKDILEWFTCRVLNENVSKFTAVKLQNTLARTSLGVFSVDNLGKKTSVPDEKGGREELDRGTLSRISEDNLLHYMKVGQERYLWPLMHSCSQGHFMLILMSLESSVSEDRTLLEVYKSRSRGQHRDPDHFSARFVEVRVGIQLLEDLVEVLGGGLDGETLQVGRILEAWRTLVPFGSPVVDKREVGELLSASRNEGIPNHLASLLSENSAQSRRVLGELLSESGQEERHLHGSFYRTAVHSLSQEEERLLMQGAGTELSLNDEFIPIIPGDVPKSQLAFGQVLNLGIGRLSSKARGPASPSSLNYLIKFSLAEVICCSAKKHPLSTRIENRGSVVEGAESMGNFIRKIGEPYASFTSGSLEFSGKLPNSVSISCHVVLPWQRVPLDSRDGSGRETTIYIPPYVSAQDNISCTKLADELLCADEETSRPLGPVSEVYWAPEEEDPSLATPVSRFKLSWNSSQSSSSKILTYWYPYELDIPIKGYFTISPESREPVKQITQSQGHFRPILTHSFRMEYCLCFDPAVIEGMQICQICIPLLPGTLENAGGCENGGGSSSNRHNIPSIMIFDHALRSSMGQIAISGDKRSIIWTIHSPQEVLGKAGSNKKFPFIQARMYGTVRLRIVYQENKRCRGGGGGHSSSQSQSQVLCSPALSSYVLNIGLYSGCPNYSRCFLGDDDPDAHERFLYSASDPFGVGIQPPLDSCPFKEIDPILLVELHPKIVKFSEVSSKKLSQREIYSVMTELIFPYSHLSFSISSSEATYRGVNIPASSISINPKALQYDKPQAHSSSGKYIIWRDSSA